MSVDFVFLCCLVLQPKLFAYRDVAVLTGIFFLIGFISNHPATERVTSAFSDLTSTILF